MASAMLRMSCETVLRVVNYAVVRPFTKCSSDFRIVSSDDRNTVVCWHPEGDFPYEKSLPIKLVEKETNSVLKVQNVQEVMTAFQNKHPKFVQEELIRITYTTKHRWVPEGIHKRRRKRDFEENRPYL